MYVPANNAPNRTAPASAPFSEERSADSPTIFLYNLFSLLLKSLYSPSSAFAFAMPAFRPLEPPIQPPTTIAAGAESVVADITYGPYLSAISSNFLRGGTAAVLNKASKTHYATLPFKRSCFFSFSKILRSSRFFISLRKSCTILFCRSFT